MLRSLFGGSHTPAETVAPLPTESYKGFEITPDPIPEEGQYRVAGWIRHAEQSHRFIRADLLPERELCAREMQRKARVLIDQQGMELFR